MKKEDFITESFEHTEKPWPKSEGITRIGQGICQRGRKWSNLNMVQIKMLFCNILNDSPDPIEYLDIHLNFISKSESECFFDVELKSYIRGFPTPINYPSPMFVAFVESFASTCAEGIEEQGILRLAIHKDGFFWDIFVNELLEDEGFYEQHFI